MGGIWILPGEVLRKELLGRSGKIQPNTTKLNRKKSVTNFLTSKLQIGVNAMKKKNRIIHSLVLLVLIAFFTACAATRTQESTGEYVDDSVITSKVKSLLAADDFLKSFQIGVESFKGVVQLSGFVNSQKAVDKAVEITRSVKGVKSVKNDLIVK
jgi:hypothetical protein